MMPKSNDWESHAREKWNHKASVWNENSKEMWDSGSRKDIMPFYRKHIQKGSAILDIGCASGYSTFKLDENNYRVIGMDISDEMINLAKINYPELAFQQGDVNRLPFENKAFDSILAINVLEWVEVPISAIKELHRVLKPNGKLCIGILGPTAGPRQNAFERLSGEKVMMNTMQPWEFAALAKDNGFEITDGMPVHKKWGINLPENLPLQALQALSFMWVFILEKRG